ncbi:hypothetical protein F4678DRAFT_424640 [Xylaria arbuscula]|nr:hypothetical protein F4678DRAFT_424640 [Xylaria arbuscula]
MDLSHSTAPPTYLSTSIATLTEYCPTISTWPAMSTCPISTCPATSTSMLVQNEYSGPQTESLSDTETVQLIPITYESATRPRTEFSPNKDHNHRQTKRRSWMYDVGRTAFSLSWIAVGIFFMAREARPVYDKSEAEIKRLEKELKHKERQNCHRVEHAARRAEINDSRRTARAQDKEDPLELAGEFMPPAERRLQAEANWERVQSLIHGLVHNVNASGAGLWF